MRSTRIRSLTEIALLVSILCVGSQLSIPTIFSVPITIQVLLVGIIGYFLPLKRALIAIITYIIIGGIGAPVFANFGGGFGVLLGYTGGFIFGFIPLVVFCSLGKGKIKILFGILGVIICHLIGIIQYSIVAKIPFLTSLVTMSLPYILKDIALIILAYLFAKILQNKLKRQS